MSQYIIQDQTLVDIADAVRSKTGVDEEITVSNLADTINTITTSDEAYQNGYTAGYGVGYDAGLNAATRTLAYDWDDETLTLVITEVQS